MHPINAYGTEEQRRKYLPKLASASGSAASASPSRTPAPTPAECARAREGGRRLPHHRLQDVDHQLADRGRVRGLGEVDAHGGKIKGFVLEKGMKGLTAPQVKQKLSLRASITGEIVMDGVEVPEDALLPNVEGLKGPFGCLQPAPLRHRLGSMGAAEACYHAARTYTLDRKQFGRPLAATQLVQMKLANMVTEITLGLQAALRVGRRFDEGVLIPETISMIKRNNVGKALDIARVARDMHGGNGISAEFHVMRHAANLETVNTYEGTHDVHGLILGRAITGLSAF
jgi:glutaryl-CoA dehydrogenase